MIGLNRTVLDTRAAVNELGAKVQDITIKVDKFEKRLEAVEESSKGRLTDNYRPGTPRAGGDVDSTRSSSGGGGQPDGGDDATGGLASSQANQKIIVFGGFPTDTDRGEIEEAHADLHARVYRHREDRRRGQVRFGRQGLLPRKGRDVGIHPGQQRKEVPFRNGA